MSNSFLPSVVHLAMPCFSEICTPHFFVSVLCTLLARVVARPACCAVLELFFYQMLQRCLPTKNVHTVAPRVTVETVGPLCAILNPVNKCGLGNFFYVTKSVGLSLPLVWIHPGVRSLVVASRLNYNKVNSLCRSVWVQIKQMPR